MRVLAIPMHMAPSRIYQSEELAARVFHVDSRIILNLIESGDALTINKKKKWFFDEALDQKRYVFQSTEDEEQVTIFGPKDFMSWSGYKHYDVLYKSGLKIINRNNGKTYQLVS